MTGVVNTDTANSAADLYADMARKIKENAANGFSGAILACPPSGEAISLFMLSPSGDEALFWSTLLTQVQMKVNDLQQRQSTGWG